MLKGSALGLHILQKFLFIFSRQLRYLSKNWLGLSQFLATEYALLTPHNFSAKESYTNLTPSAFLFIFMRNDSRVPFCDSANHKTTTITTTSSLKPPLQVREIDSFAKVSNRDIIPFIGSKKIWRNFFGSRMAESN